MRMVSAAVGRIPAERNEPEAAAAARTQASRTRAKRAAAMLKRLRRLERVFVSSADKRSHGPELRDFIEMRTTSFLSQFWALVF